MDSGSAKYADSVVISRLEVIGIKIDMRQILRLMKDGAFHFFFF